MVYCICGKGFPRDPRLEIKCSTCPAAIGQQCRRPSGHTRSPGSSLIAFHAPRVKIAWELFPCDCIAQWEAAQAGEKSIQISLL